jgi:hypothetical protein
MVIEPKVTTRLVANSAIGSYSEPAKSNLCLHVIYQMHIIVKCPSILPVDSFQDVVTRMLFAFLVPSTLIYAIPVTCQFYLSCYRITDPLWASMSYGLMRNCHRNWGRNLWPFHSLWEMWYLLVYLFQRCVTPTDAILCRIRMLRWLWMKNRDKYETVSLGIFQFIMRIFASKHRGVPIDRKTVVLIQE